jgi:hypothetical protein
MTAMKKLALLTLALLTASAGNVFAQDVRFNFDQQANFASFKTYKWVVLKGAEQVDNLIDQQIKSAIDAELATKGLTRVESDSADLYIGYQAAVTTEKQYTSFDTGWGYGPGYGRGWYGGGVSSTTGTTSTIYIGTVAVDMYTPANKSLVWRGAASKTLDTKAKPEKRQKNMAKAMKKLLKNFPPPPPKS